MSAQTNIDPSVRGTRRTIGLALIVAGVSLFVVQMVYLLVQNYRTGLRPSGLLIAGIACSWIVWFIGKTLLKSRGTTSES